MKKLKSLMLTFSLAVAGFATLGTATAQAQSVPVRQQTAITVSQNQPQDLVNNNYVADAVVEAVSRLPMNNDKIFPRAQIGFTTAVVDQTGENVGIQWRLNGNTKTPMSAFNLDDPSSQQMFDVAVANARQTESNIVAQQSVRYSAVYAPVVPVYFPAYTYVRPIRPIVLFGPIFDPWRQHNVYRHPVSRGPAIIINTHGNDHRGDRHRGGDQRGGDHRGQRPGGHRH